MRNRPTLGLVLLLVALCSGWMAQAHEIPNDVRVQIYLKPEGDTLIGLIRVPLAAMRDFEFSSRESGSLDLERIDSQLVDAVSLWLLNDLSIYQSGRRLEVPKIDAVRLALPNDHAFDDFATARRSIYSERLAVDTELYREQALLEVALVYEIQSERAEFMLEPTLARLGMHTLTEIRFLSADGEPRGISFVGDPGRVSLDPGFLEVFKRFFGVGFSHVLDGMDHLLFVVALVIPLFRFRTLVVVITAFTLAHSITLAASLFDLVPSSLWFPPLVEVLIAASIVYMAFENLLKPSVGRRWLVAFGFGLVHGFGFSFALRETLQFAGDHLLTSLFAFNLGIEIGQLLVLILVVPLLHFAARRLPVRPMIILLSALVAHTAWHWLVERWQLLGQYTFTLPAADLSLALGAVRWLILILVVTLVIWLLRVPLERWVRSAAE